LSDALAASRWTSSGDAGQRLLNRKDPRVSPLVAATLVLHGLAQIKPRPGRFISFLGVAIYTVDTSDFQRLAAGAAAFDKPL
jgi:hypothetical protein